MCGYTLVANIHAYKACPCVCIIGYFIIFMFGKLFSMWSNVVTSECVRCGMTNVRLLYDKVKGRMDGYALCVLIKDCQISLVLHIEVCLIATGACSISIVTSVDVLTSVDHNRKNRAFFKMMF